jgi:Molybdopterin converting factor, large subunit
MVEAAMPQMPGEGVAHAGGPGPRCPAPQLVDGPLDVEGLRRSVTAETAGAVVVFVGTTRRKTGDVITEQLEYEAHRPLAVACLRRLQAEAVKRFSLEGCGVVHRLGVVEVGEESVAVVAASQHRPAAFAATAWLMDRLKACVPIWKREHAADGAASWVHGEERPGP